MTQLEVAAKMIQSNLSRAGATLLLAVLGAACGGSDTETSTEGGPSTGGESTGDAGKATEGGSAAGDASTAEGESPADGGSTTDGASAADSGHTTDGGTTSALAVNLEQRGHRASALAPRARSNQERSRGLPRAFPAAWLGAPSTGRAARRRPSDLAGSPPARWACSRTRA